MPAAKCCGQQVDHNPGLLVCAVCNDLIHPACVNISPDEFEFYASDKIPYKCVECLTARRTSISSSPPLFPLSSNSSGTQDDLANLPHALATGISTEQSGEETLIHFDDVTSDDATILSHPGIASSVSLILQELVKLRASQNDLHATVEALRDDNVALKADNEALKADNVVFKKDNEALRADNANMLSELSLVHDKLDSLLAVIEAPDAVVKSPKRKKTAGSKSTKPHSVNEPFPALLARTESPSTASYSHVIRSRLNLPTNSNTGTNSNTTPTINANSSSNTPSNASIRNIKRPPIVIGLSNNSGLDVIDKKQWFHLSSFKNTVTPESIVSFVEKTFNIPGSSLGCYRLVKKDADISKLKSINFKLGVETCHAEKIMDASLWPANIKIRKFDFLEKSADQLKEKIAVVVKDTV